MEYTVGSIADLISGKNTPNKPKVVKKELIYKKRETAAFEDAPKSKEKPTEFKKSVSFKHESIKKRLNKKHAKKISDTTDFAVIDHKLFEKVQKAEAIKSESNEDVNIDTDSEASIHEKQKTKKYKQERSQTRNNIQNVETKAINQQSSAVKQEINSRTLFVGNIGVATKKKQLIRFFGKYGKIQSVRLRCATPANPGIPKKVALIKNLLHSKRTTLHSYVTFEKREDAFRAQETNGTKYKEHYLRVQICDDAKKPDANKAIFVGNLPFDVEDDDLWTAFESIGGISSVRVIRNAATGMGIGVGYVNFNSSDAVELALQMDDVTVKNKQVRIQRCKAGKNKHKERKDKEQPTKSDNEKDRKPRQKKEKTKFKELGSIAVKNTVFQGNKSNKKKKKSKVNKGLIQKLTLSRKIAPR